MASPSAAVAVAVDAPVPAPSPAPAPDAPAIATATATATATAAASPALAAPASVNGVAVLSRPGSPSSVNSSTKRKRDASDDGDEPELNGSGCEKPTINGVHTSQDRKSLIRDFFDVLQSFDTSSPAILKRPLPDASSDDGPSAKRAKSEDMPATTIADKMTQDNYHVLDDLVSDITLSVDAHVKELESSAAEADPLANDEAIAKTVAFKQKALELFRRELAYPNVAQPPPAKTDLKEALPPSAMGGLVLSTVGMAPTVKPLFTSLQQTRTPEGTLKAIADAALPSGVSTTHILPDPSASADKNSRPLTLGELFPSPRNLPPLQPPKAPKTTTKSNVLTFYHPELTEKSKYRSGTYFTQNISAGHWLDYSNATPTTPAKTKQRERAQSLAGHKPSTTELEVSEMEALFRGAFSSFAPCKDDSAAIIPSNQVSRMWWQRVGRRNFEKMVDADLPEEDIESAQTAEPAEVMDFDEELVKSAIDSWDDSAIDPSLDEIMGKKSDEDKEIDDVLEEVSDMIETLASYQRNRNLTLPTSQDRYSADPVNGDMLRNGSLSHQPSEEEMLTYQALKAQLSLIIKALPPYAVARLNSDKLEELSVSTKIEIRSDEYKGVMEEDEPARLSRQAAQTAANSTQRQQHRAPSVSAASPYNNHQFQGQFVPTARPISNTQHFPQTPVRPQQNIYQQRPPSSVPLPQHHHQAQQRVPPATQYRPQNYGYAPQLAKAQTPYGHSNMPQYAASPTQPRMQQNFIPPQAANHNHRFPPNFPGYQQHQQMLPQQPQHPQHPQHAQQHPQHIKHHSPLPQHQQMPQHQQQHPQHQQQPPYSPYTNGSQLPRTMSPQVPQAHQYNQAPTPPQQHQQIPRPSYGSPAQGMQVNPNQRQYNANAAQGMMPGGRPPPNLTGYQTVMPEVQQRQVMEQARARADAEQRVSGHMGKVTQGEVVGLAGIGLGGNVDVHKIAAAKAMNTLNLNNMSPSPKMPMGNMHGGPSPVNGGTPIPPPQPPQQRIYQQQPPTSASPIPIPVPGFKPPQAT
ncbi:hypothetical protein B0T22DRAFT_514609 [Podospora appendiculata]|uniref:Uncharacterized protein n=1 Tax=Podospora appendiculata TaxID=314037 RepID=A0AAE0XC02_9PEZI|nr:hypothetical protein B0T22DRAFT_514609 [Podospora appendiculata]